MDTLIPRIYLDIQYWFMKQTFCSCSGSVFLLHQCFPIVILRGHRLQLQVSMSITKDTITWKFPIMYVWQIYLSVLYIIFAREEGNVGRECTVLYLKKKSDHKETPRSSWPSGGSKMVCFSVKYWFEKKGLLHFKYVQRSGVNWLILKLRCGRSKIKGKR